MSDILQIAQAVLKVSVVAFIVGNLLAIGLETDLKAALAPLGDMRFIVTAMLLDWLLCPGFAWLITRLLPIALPYATGLLLIGLAPAAPFLPMMVRRDRRPCTPARSLARYGSRASRPGGDRSVGARVRTQRGDCSSP